MHSSIEREIRSVGVLIIWTDCDREGENIGAEIRDICLNIKSSVRVRRIKFKLYITGKNDNLAYKLSGFYKL